MKKSFWLLLCFGLGFDPQVFSTSPGDREVATRFAHYLESGKGCSPTNNGPRVIISGFGLWAHQSLNLSGLVIDHLAADDSASTDRSGALARDEDVRIRNRTFRLQNGQEISACLILVNVMWDFAGAVVANEMSRFQPDAVIMTGVSSKAYLEAGAFKFADFKPGYNSDGTPDTINTPFSRVILPNPKAPLELAMNWDRRKLAGLITPLLNKMGVQLMIPDEARSGNWYICNDMSYLALAAAKNLRLRLAENKIVLKPSVHSNPKIGFFHFPNVRSLEPRLVHNYAHVILTLAEGMLSNRLGPTVARK